MRPTVFFLAGLAAAAITAPALADPSARAAKGQEGVDKAAPAPSQEAEPTAADIRTPVPTVDLRTLSASDIARRNALYGPGWQYRMAPISPGLNAGVPINPGVGVAPTDLSKLDLRIKADEVVMSRMRDAELAREDAQIAAVEPALPWVWQGRKVPPFLHNVDFPHVGLPDFAAPFRWVRNRF